MKLFVGVVWVLLIETLLPMAIGSHFPISFKRQSERILFAWIAGQCLIWGALQAVSVPFILMGSSFFSVLICLGLAIALLIGWMAFRHGNHQNSSEIYASKKLLSDFKLRTPEGIILLVFGILLVFQIVMAVFYTYADGDDAFYVAISTTAAEGIMYGKDPYTGLVTTLDPRYGLAPFTLWASILSFLSGIPVVTISHILIPVCLIPMAYGIYYLIANLLFEDKAEYVSAFMIFVSVLILFGDYSIMSPENFLIARSRQGKAALAGILIPFVFYLLLRIFRMLKSQVKIPYFYWLILSAVNFSACLCSTLGSLFICLLLGVTCLVAAVVYKKFRFLIPVLITMLPCICYAALYIAMD